uniref:PB1 domain-containing protein n=1 Tax=Pyramimonas obovata TaxID=1411642 RepID=A0A7S0MSF5_9CHLO|mmetsp:Transcript_115/g.269  ORF Transcript_115/g.269 Transcript_115/m.269 type:complete len:606 (+) Transcript_115:99-1916(+)|eukprot:CAMPEP_0118922412 /NCGR_PEP_ID=MMETSP1169-20130426/1344_1 /TAXON_ID=36882 /ORGANISM="Pyramimonas obovata, Strain CCMP722" /LENGTH=605 /DNA_ID=CAMNT_0006863275 /DNA_START=78 /DNA_END=1895 /DNA_ORIENTATION=-
MTKAKAKVKAVEPSEDELFLKRAHELKEKGNAHFARREHVQALASYAQALRLAPEGHVDRALFHSNRAACYLRDNQFNEVIHECNEALKVSPKFAKALLRRSRAYELKGDLQKALTDVRSLTSDAELAGNNLTEAQEMATRLEASLKNTTKKQRAKARQMMVQNSQAQAQAMAAAPQARKPVQPLTLKVTLGSDTRMVQVPGMLPFNDLVTMIRRKFPEEQGQLALKYRDRDNQLITVTNRQDLLAAVASSVAAAAQAAAASKAGPAGLGGAGLGKGLPPQGPPAVALELVRAEETEEVVEFDDWLLDFAELFREHLGIDADGHVDLHNIGLEKCNQALEAAVSSEKAAPLFDQAAAKFQEVAALALLNWGNVHMCQARRLFDTAADDKEKAVTISPEARAKAEEHYFAAEAKYQKALELKEDFYEAVIASGQQLFERAKLLSTAEGKAKDEKKVEELFEAAQAKLQEALVLIPENAAVDAEPAAAEKQEEKKPAEAEAAPGQADEVLVRSQVLVMWGNVLYEQSQVRAQQGKEWEPLLDTAVAKFREAKCSEDDISGALASHAGKKAQEPAKKEEPKKAEPKKEDSAAPKLPPKKEKKPKSGKK